MPETAAIKAADGSVARPADTIPVEAEEAAKIETAVDINEANAAKEDEAAKADGPSAPPGTGAAGPAVPQEQPSKVQKLPDWAEKRIAEEAFHRREEARRRREEEQQRKAIEEENKRLQAQLAALTGSQGSQTPEAQALRAPAAAPGLAVDPADFERAVAAEAERRAAEAQFNAECNKVYEEGVKAYPDFEDALKNLATLGVLESSFLQTVIATGEGARLLHELGSNPDEAAKLIALPPAKFAIELGKRAAAKQAAKTPAPVSNAPAPIKPLEGSARVSNEPRDDDDDATWFAKRQAQLRERRRA